MKLTIEDYIEMAKHFNQLSFRSKIMYLSENKDIITLGADYNWWVVKANDDEIQEQLYESDNNFRIENEWGSEEMYILVQILGLKIVDA